MSKKPSHKLAIGTTLGALFAAGAATFFFTKTQVGKQAIRNVKKVATELSKDLAHRVSALQSVTEAKYSELVDEIVDQYAAQKKVGKTTVKALKRDLKAHWREVRLELKKSKK